LLLELGHWMSRSAIGREVANGSVATSSSVSTVEMSKMLFNQYVFPFEATSVLILIAILGALVLAKRDDQ
jgi:NADH-quinone oxidoreductase subunit J